MSRDATGELRLRLWFAWFKLLESGKQTFQHRCGLFGGVVYSSRSRRPISMSQRACTIPLLTRMGRSSNEGLAQAGNRIPAVVRIPELPRRGR